MPTAQVSPRGRERLAELRAVAIARIGEHAAEVSSEAQPRRDHAVELRERELAFRPGRELLRGHAGRAAAGRVLGPLPRQEEPERNADRHLVARQRQRDEHLAIRELADAPRIRPGHTHGAHPLLEEGRVVDDQHRLRPADHPLRPRGEHPLERRRGPAAPTDGVVELRVVVRCDVRRHGLDALPLPRPEEPLHVDRPQGSRRLSPSAAQNGASQRSNSRSHAVCFTVAPSSLPNASCPSLRA